MEAYLDNSATTKVFENVKDIMVEIMTEDYGNPSSMHMRGVEAERYIRRSAEMIAEILKVEEKEIIFTSGGTESNNLAILGAAMANRRAGMHIITTAVEHASVHSPMEYLKEQGFRVTSLGVDASGVISLDELEHAICEDTILISVMYVNNEIGSVMPIDGIAEIIRRKKPDILFHVDAIQAFGKFEIYPKRQHIDLLSVSGHKIHGPKGTGFLYIRDKCRIRPLLLGGGQQRGLRSGTENVPGIAGLGVAAKEIYENLPEKRAGLQELKDHLIEKLQQMENVKINSQGGTGSAPHIVNVSFLGIRSEVLLHALEEKNIFVSSGSACSSNKQKQTVSATLKGIGLSIEEAESALRFSFSIFTTREEIDYTLDVIRELLPKLRLYIRKK